MTHVLITLVDEIINIIYKQGDLVVCQSVSQRVKKGFDLVGGFALGPEMR